MPRKVTPALQYSEGRSKIWSGSKLVNAYAQRAEGDKADQFMVQAIPGLELFADIEPPGIRGMHVMAGIVYVVVGDRLFRLTDNPPNASLIGTVGGDLPVMMADNGTQLAIQGGVNNDQGYVYDGSTLHTNIPNLPPVSNVVFIDGYFAWSVYESDQFIISALGDGLSYDPLDVATVEGDPDDIVSLVNQQRQLFFGGSLTFEIWYNSGAADFPFIRQGNAFVERGILDRDSLVKIDNAFHFVGNDRIVYRMEGYSPVRISTHAIEFKIASASWFRGFTYTQEGAKFYVLSTDLGTFAYDMSTGAWHERRSLGRVNYRVGYAVDAFGGTIMGDIYTGKVYRPSLDLFTEDGDVIPVEILMPGIQTDRSKATLYSFELYCETGVGNALDTEPQVILQWSKDGGRNFSAELPRALGAEGEYLTRCIWRLGISFRQIQLRIQLPSITKRYVVSGYADVR